MNANLFSEPTDNPCQPYLPWKITTRIIKIDISGRHTLWRTWNVSYNWSSGLPEIIMAAVMSKENYAETHDCSDFVGCYRVGYHLHACRGRGCEVRSVEPVLCAEYVAVSCASLRQDQG